MTVAKEQIRQIISENNLSNVADVYSLLIKKVLKISYRNSWRQNWMLPSFKKKSKRGSDHQQQTKLASSKSIKSQCGEFQVDVPRDRNGEFEPKLIPKYQRNISGIKEKVISLYARRMSTRDVHDQLQDLYGIAISAEMVGIITDKILPQVKV